MHLGDYETDRGEVEVTCGKHIPKGVIPNRTMVWFIDYSEVITGKQDYPNMDNDETWNEQPIVYVRALTDNAWKNRLQNHPNVGSCFGVPLQELKMFHYGLEMWTRGQIAEERSNV
jgi:hypothetical protein